MEKYKNILINIMWVGLVLGIIISLGFVNKSQDELLCESIEVKINQDEELYFLSAEDVVGLIKDRADSIENHPKRVVNIPEIEHKLNSHDDIENAEVFLTIDGKLKVKVKQRKPIVRIFNKVGESYYMDNNGRLMPLSQNYTAKVLIANGNIGESYAKNYKKSITSDTITSKTKRETILDEIYAMANYISNDEFWSAQIQQIYVNNENDMELVPMVGNHKIVFGDTADMDEKFNKLMTFYQKGLNVTGWWDKYEIINLKYKNQIVCTKK